MTSDTDAMSIMASYMDGYGSPIQRENSAYDVSAPSMMMNFMRENDWPEYEDNESGDEMNMITDTVEEDSDIEERGYRRHERFYLREGTLFILVSLSYLCISVDINYWR